MFKQQYNSGTCRIWNFACFASKFLCRGWIGTKFCHGLNSCVSWQEHQTTVERTDKTSVKQLSSPLNERRVNRHVLEKKTVMDPKKDKILVSTQCLQTNCKYEVTNDKNKQPAPLYLALGTYGNMQNQNTNGSVQLLA